MYTLYRYIYIYIARSGNEDDKLGQGAGQRLLRYQVELEATGFHFYVDGGGDAKQRNHKKGARQISTSVLPGEMTREVRSVLTYRIHVQMSGRLGRIALAMKAIKHAHTPM